MKLAWVGSNGHANLHIPRNNLSVYFVYLQKDIGVFETMATRKKRSWIWILVAVFVGLGCLAFFSLKTLTHTPAKIDPERLARVAVLGDNVRKQLFGERPVKSGVSVALNGLPFRIVGLMPPKT